MPAKLRNVITHESDLSVMPVSAGLASFVTMVLVRVREWIWDILERGLEAEDLGVPPEALGCLIFELPKI